jgi:hypothetical protein
LQMCIDNRKKNNCMTVCIVVNVFNVYKYITKPKIGVYKLALLT